MLQMKTIEIIQKLMDEMAVFSEIAKEMPHPYKTIIDNKILGFNLYLSKVLTIETENQNNEMQNITSDLLEELESPIFKEN